MISLGSLVKFSNCQMEWFKHQRRQAELGAPSDAVSFLPTHHPSNVWGCLTEGA